MLDQIFVTVFSGHENASLGQVWQLVVIWLGLCLVVRLHNWLLLWLGLADGREKGLLSLAMVDLLMDLG